MLFHFYYHFYFYFTFFSFICVLFPRYWKYNIVLGDCNIFCFIYLCNEDYDRKKRCSVNNQVPTFTITDTNLYVLVVTLFRQDNAKLFEQLRSGFERTIKLNKYQSKVTI